MEETELKKILEQHTLWLETDGKEGSRANLQEADLQGAELRWANLQRANLQWANLQEADLRDAYLQRADLREANLHRAYLEDANLQGANLQEADLMGADLRDVNLQDVNLQWADLQWANLRGVNLRGAYLQEADLQEADFRLANLQEANLQGAENIELAILTDSQKQELGLKVKDEIQQQAKQNIKIKRLEEQIEKQTEDKETETVAKLTKKLSELQNIKAEKDAIEKEKIRLEKEKLDKQSDSLKEVVEKISTATETSKDLLDFYRFQSKWLMYLGVFLYISAIVVGSFIYIDIDTQAAVKNWYIFAPTLLLSFIATALLRHDWKVRQLSEALVNHQNTTEMATGILKASLILQTIEGTSDNILEESFTDIRGVLLTGGNKNKSFKDDSSLEKMMMNNGVKAIK